MSAQLKTFAYVVPLALALLCSGLSVAASTDGAYAVGEMALGSEEAPVTVIEYASMTCPHCATFHAETYKGFKEKYVDTGKVRFVFREFPLDRLALRAAMLARCSGEDRFFPMLDVLFSQQKSWSRAESPMAALARIGRLGGVSQQRFDACMADEQLLNIVLQNRMTGENEHQVGSTPTFIINGDSYPGHHSPEQFDEILGKYLP